jgi:hypothetical protein
MDADLVAGGAPDLVEAIRTSDTLALATDRPRDVHHVLSLHGEGGSLVFRKLFNLFSTLADVQFTVTNVS